MVVNPALANFGGDPARQNAPWVPRAPVRGTQSFVGTMSSVWRRPGLTASEAGWRWLVGVPLLALVVWQGSGLWPAIQRGTVALPTMTVFRPLEAFRILQDSFGSLFPTLWPTARWLLPLLVAVWSLAWAGGRGFVLNRLDGDLHPRFLTLLALRMLRTFGLLLLLAVWWQGASWAASTMISVPGGRGQEPNLVLFCAVIICGSLLLFVAWATLNWVLDAAPLLAMRRGLGAVSAVRQTLQLGRVRGKLAEINLVMGIVKIALLVLALVFSACPLPFEGVATQDFLVKWWIGVAVFYFLASDYFHVVRSAAYLALFRE